MQATSSKGNIISYGEKTLEQKALKFVWICSKKIICIKAHIFNTILWIFKSKLYKILLKGLTTNSVDKKNLLQLSDLKIFNIRLWEFLYYMY